MAQSSNFGDRVHQLLAVTRSLPQDHHRPPQKLKLRHGAESKYLMPIKSKALNNPK